MIEDAALARAVREAGITRVADVTGLDCFGVPVWQAIRPCSRALSVHQGKGFTAAAARRGAIMEGLESHHAEQWHPALSPTPTLELRRGVIWSALPQASNCPAPGDWAQHDGAIDPSQPLDWFGVEAIGGTPDFYVPLDAIHLDCTRPLANGVATNSNGQAAHETLAAATLAGLFELVERDACAAWLAGSAVARAGTEIAAGDIADRDVQMVLARAAVRRVGVRLYRVPALVDVAVIAAELVDHGENRNGHTHVLGSAARFCPVEAVRAALLEALQTRCTEIAGGRDTIPLTNVEIAGRTRARPLGMASRPGWSGHRFNAAVGGPSCLASLIAAIAAAGYPQIGRTILSPPASVATTVKTFVPGLGFEQRRRRQ